MRTLKILAALATALTLTGCHSATIAATISNHTSAPLSLIELDYPSASFGTQTLAPGQDFHYRFKIIGGGATTILWTDAAHQDHKSSGPTLRDGDDGKLTITFNSDANPAWKLELLHPAPSS
jgi:hypothetical protein